MCSRYFVNAELWETVERQFPEITGEEALPDPFARATGDIRPSMPAPALIAGADDALSAAALIWGFPGFDGKRPVINARAESVAQKNMFAESFRGRRCVLPAAGFYEWNRTKEKYTFTPDRSPVLYLGGVWRMYGGDARFVIITREANASMLPVHDRMPLLIPQEKVRDWLLAPREAEKLLAEPLPRLTSGTEYKQMSLFDEEDRNGEHNESSIQDHL